MTNPTYAAAVAEQAEAAKPAEAEAKNTEIADQTVEQVAETENPQPAEEVKEPAKPRKSAEQRRIDRLTREKYELKAALEYERQAKAQARAGDDEQDGQLDIEALVEKKLAERDAERQARDVESKRDAIFAKAAKESPDFDAEDFLESTPVTTEMAKAILDSDVAEKVVAYLYSNPDEAELISELPEARQAAAIGRIEAKLLAPKEPVKKSNAPAPVKPVGAGQVQSTGYTSDMSDAEFAKLRRSGRIY